MATVKDVAKLAGVGSGTVSRYISGTGSVSRKSAEKIARAIEQLNYRPNSMARSLSSRRSDLIGVWVPSLEGPYYHMMIRTIESALRLHGKHMILANAEDAQSNEDRMAHLDYLINRDCDGILIFELPAERIRAGEICREVSQRGGDQPSHRRVGRSFLLDRSRPRRPSGGPAPRRAGAYPRGDHYRQAFRAGRPGASPCVPRRDG